MSKELTVIEEKDHDFSQVELDRIKAYKESGLPGIANVTTADVHKILDLYFGGSTYTQISNTLGIKKIIILYLSDINGWYAAKKEYLNEIEEKIKMRVIDTKLRNKEFMLLLVQAMQKKISHNLTRYLATNDPTHMETLDYKELGQLMKAIEMVNEYDNASKNQNGKASPIGLNLGPNGVTIEKTGDGQVSITPKEVTLGDSLRFYADKKREEEKAKIAEVPKQLPDKE